MSRVLSADGTPIAYDKTGRGEPVILVGGLFSYRAWPQPRELARLLSRRFTVVNYDRRGRGESGDTQPYAVQREVEDLDALIGAVGGSACVCGWSSGGVLALKAAAAGSIVKRLASMSALRGSDHRGQLPWPAVTGAAVGRRDNADARHHRGKDRWASAGSGTRAGRR